MHEARAQAERFDTVLLVLRFDGAAPVVSVMLLSTNAHLPSGSRTKL